MTRGTCVSSPARAQLSSGTTTCLMGKVRTLARPGLPGGSCLPLPSPDCYPGELVLAIPYPSICYLFFSFCPYCLPKTILSDFSRVYLCSLLGYLEPCDSLMPQPFISLGLRTHAR